MRAIAVVCLLAAAVPAAAMDIDVKLTTQGGKDASAKAREAEADADLAAIVAEVNAAIAAENAKVAKEAARAQQEYQLRIEQRKRENEERAKNDLEPLPDPTSPAVPTATPRPPYDVKTWAQDELTAYLARLLTARRQNATRAAECQWWASVAAQARDARCREIGLQAPCAVPAGCQ
jgi:hypothetical protein